MSEEQEVTEQNDLLAEWRLDPDVAEMREILPGYAVAICLKESMYKVYGIGKRQAKLIDYSWHFEDARRIAGEYADRAY